MSDGMRRWGADSLVPTPALRVSFVVAGVLLAAT